MSDEVFYAVACGRKPGVYLTWKEAHEQVNGFSGAKFKKFKSMRAAQDFVQPTDILFQKSRIRASKSKSIRIKSEVSSQNYRTNTYNSTKIKSEFSSSSGNYNTNSSRSSSSHDHLKIKSEFPSSTRNYNTHSSRSSSSHQHLSSSSNSSSNRNHSSLSNQKHSSSHSSFHNNFSHRTSHRKSKSSSRTKYSWDYIYERPLACSHSSSRSRSRSPSPRHVSNSRNLSSHRSFSSNSQHNSHVSEYSYQSPSLDQYSNRSIYQPMRPWTGIKTLVPQGRRRRRSFQFMRLPLGLFLRVVSYVNLKDYYRLHRVDGFWLDRLKRGSTEQFKIQECRCCKKRYRDFMNRWLVCRHPTGTVERNCSRSQKCRKGVCSNKYPCLIKGVVYRCCLSTATKRHRINHTPSE